MFYLLTFFYGLSLGIQILAAKLVRKSSIAICPHCFRKVNLEKTAFCCDRKIKMISESWNLAPLAFGLFFFLVFSSIFLGSNQFYGVNYPVLPELSFWTGSLGCLIGGIEAWRINLKINRKKSWIFLVLGIISAFFFPLLISTV